jgi:hypothetical protein
MGNFYFPDQRVDDLGSAYSNVIGATAWPPHLTKMSEPCKRMPLAKFMAGLESGWLTPVWATSDGTDGGTAIIIHSLTPLVNNTLSVTLDWTGARPKLMVGGNPYHMIGAVHTHPTQRWVNSGMGWLSRTNFGKACTATVIATERLVQMTMPHYADVPGINWDSITEACKAAYPNGAELWIMCDYSASGFKVMPRSGVGATTVGPLAYWNFEVNEGGAPRAISLVRTSDGNDWFDVATLPDVLQHRSALWQKDVRPSSTLTSLGFDGSAAVNPYEYYNYGTYDPLAQDLTLTGADPANSAHGIAATLFNGVSLADSAFITDGADPSLYPDMGTTYVQAPLSMEETDFEYNGTNSQHHDIESSRDIVVVGPAVRSMIKSLVWSQKIG